MNYWPTTLFLRNPFLTWESKQELLSIGKPGAVLSEGTIRACHTIAEHSPGNGASLVRIYNEGTPTRRAYLKHPKPEDWEALERGGFVATHDGFGFSLDALH